MPGLQQARYNICGKGELRLTGWINGWNNDPQIQKNNPCRWQHVKQEPLKMEILLTLAAFIALALVLVAMVSFIPFWITNVTKADNDQKHIYSIYMRDSGTRGRKILSAANFINTNNHMKYFT